MNYEEEYEAVIKEGREAQRRDWEEVQARVAKAFAEANKWEVGMRTKENLIVQAKKQIEREAEDQAVIYIKDCLRNIANCQVVIRDNQKAIADFKVASPLEDEQMGGVVAQKPSPVLQPESPEPPERPQGELPPDKQAE